MSEQGQTYPLTVARLQTFADLVDVQPADASDVERWLDRMGAEPTPADGVEAAAARNPLTCLHEAFESVVTVNRLNDPGDYTTTPPRHFVADVTVRCARCSLPFRFLGLTSGVNFSGPTTSPDDEELRAPIAPAFTHSRRLAHDTAPEQPR